jgi:hypothetical protein
VGGQLDHHGNLPRPEGHLLALAYGLYATFALLSFFFVARFIDETKGMQLEDMHAKVAPHKIRHPEEHPAGLD